ncbi:hypothetical protein PTKIN_Ptkin16aG0500500 [Pterospermum kingtungense]
MEVLQHFSHNHPLVFIEDQQSHEGDKAYCSGCEEVIEGPRYSCEACGFHLDENCAKAASEINHPFHRVHSLNLLPSSPYKGMPVCNFCGKDCKKFVYHCSCKIDLHIKCALFSSNIADKRIGDELQHIAYEDPSISVDHHPQELKEANCFTCRSTLLDSAYLSLVSGFYLHKKCIELPLEINHLCHRKHPLLLQFKPQFLPWSCQICKELIQYLGLVYCCSTCEFALHVNCVSPTPTIQGEVHEHPFTLFWRQVPFICDACGTQGDYVSYICSTCSLIVHEKCISLPPIIKFPRHRHKISHTFILGEHRIKTLKCRICPEEVNPQHGSYCCSGCDYLVHANCAKEDYSWYEFDETDEQLNEDPVFVVIKEANIGENMVTPTEIKHLSHEHNLVLSNEVGDDIFCDGCRLSISTLFYCCSKCDFFLHQSCAESPRKKYHWGHVHQRPLTLILNRTFACQLCYYEFNNGFAYECNVCKEYCNCLRCSLISDTPTCEGHEHRLTFYDKYEAQCRGCEDQLHSAFACKDCNFAVEYNCLVLPKRILHKCDEHPLFLTYHEDNVYSEYLYCDVCEEPRNPNHWFYHCGICDKSAHPKCVVRKSSFIKLGSTYTKGNHPHPLTFTQKDHDYAVCQICDQPWFDDLALECVQNGCKFIVHWKCIKPPEL